MSGAILSYLARMAAVEALENAGIDRVDCDDELALTRAIIERIEEWLDVYAASDSRLDPDAGSDRD